MLGPSAAAYLANFVHKHMADLVFFPNSCACHSVLCTELLAHTVSMVSLHLAGMRLLHAGPADCLMQYQVIVVRIVAHCQEAV